MSATARHLTPTRRRLRLVRRQARPRYQLRDPKPTPLRPWRINWVHDWSELIGGIVLVIAAVELWSFVRWH